MPDAQAGPRADPSVTNRHTGETITFLGVRRTDRGDVLEIRTTLPPGGEGPPTHIHPHQDEEGTVLAGRVALRTDGVVREFGPGEEVRIPAGSAHTWWNAGNEPLELAGRLRPPMRFEAFLREMYGAMNAGRDGRPSPVAAMDILSRYAGDQRLPGLPVWVQTRVFGAVVAVARGVGIYRRAPSSGAGPSPKSRP